MFSSLFNGTVLVIYEHTPSKTTQLYNPAGSVCSNKDKDKDKHAASMPCHGLVLSCLGRQFHHVCWGKGKWHWRSLFCLSSLALSCRSFGSYLFLPCLMAQKVPLSSFISYTVSVFCLFLISCVVSLLSRWASDLAFDSRVSHTCVSRISCHRGQGIASKFFAVQERASRTIEQMRSLSSLLLWCICLLVLFCLVVVLPCLVAILSCGCLVVLSCLVLSCLLCMVLLFLRSK